MKNIFGNRAGELNLTLIVIIFLVIVIACCVIFCRPASIVGKWETELGEDIEFFENGTFVACSDFGEQGTYNLENDKLVIIPRHDDAIVLDVGKITAKEIALYEDGDDDCLMLYRVD